MYVLSHFVPHRLDRLAEEAFIEYSLNLFSTLEQTQNEAALQRYVKTIEKLPPDFVTETLNHLLEEFANDRNYSAGLNALKVLANPETRILRMNNYCESITVSILETIHENCSENLQHLELMNSYLKVF